MTATQSTRRGKFEFNITPDRRIVVSVIGRGIPIDVIPASESDRLHPTQVITEWLACYEGGL